MAKVRATKAREKLNFDKKNATETVKKHADKPIPVPWYGKKEDSKRGF